MKIINLRKAKKNSTLTESNEDEDPSKKFQDQFIMCLENFSLKKQKNSKEQNDENENICSQINNYSIKEQLINKALLQFKEYKLTENKRFYRTK